VRAASLRALGLHSSPDARFAQSLRQWVDVDLVAQRKPSDCSAKEYFGLISVSSQRAAASLELAGDQIGRTEKMSFLIIRLI
jgi:hypothetical protein